MPNNGWIEKKVRDIYHNGILFSHKKWNPIIYDIMNECAGYYVQWNKPSKTNTLGSHSFVKSKKNKWSTRNKKTEQWLPDLGRVTQEGACREVSQKIPSYSKIGRICSAVILHTRVTMAKNNALNISQ